MSVRADLCKLAHRERGQHGKNHGLRRVQPEPHVSSIGEDEPARFVMRRYQNEESKIADEVCRNHGPAHTPPTSVDIARASNPNPNAAESFLKREFMCAATIRPE
jgi:hypothetical protein